jgi:hypothetical protein
MEQIFLHGPPVAVAVAAEPRVAGMEVTVALGGGAAEKEVRPKASMGVMEASPVAAAVAAVDTKHLKAQH